MSDTPFQFLIIGAGRGGTSLLAALVGSHSQMTVELEQDAARCLLHRNPDPAEPPEDPRTLLPSRTAAFRAACEGHAARSKLPLWGNKITTEQILALEQHNQLNPDAPRNVFAHFFGERFADVKIVFLLRDGRACVRSKIARAGRTPERACQAWSYCVRMYEHLSHAGNAPGGVCLVRFEELLRDPTQTLTTICQFLGVEFEPTMLAGTRSDKLIPDYQRDTIEAARAELPVDPQPWYGLIEDDLHLTGYL